MDNFEVPIFKKTYDLYKEFYVCLKNFPKQDKYSLGDRCNLILVEIMEYLLAANSLGKFERMSCLEKVSIKLNIFRVYLRLAKDIKALDDKKYILIQGLVDEIGRMLGGWIRMLKAQ